jgi:O-antigen/teichoic acid export membrane protein
MIVTFYATRVVLRVLGASDFGLYNVVGGIVSMFSMFGTTLTAGTQRFMNFALGENDIPKLKQTFSIALCLHIVIIILLLIIAETFGLWFLQTQMNIPDGRATAAFWVYQFSVVALMLNLFQVPFSSCLIAHEEMNMYAYMSIYDAVMKLLIVFLIQWITFDKLILYAAFIFLVLVSSTFIYIIYCRHRFEECSFRLLWNKKLAKQIIEYSGWNIFGTSLSFFTGQGINIVLNIFCGTIINAARGLAMTVNTAIVQFCSNFQVAVNPQIVKNYAAKEYHQMYNLMVNNARIVEYLYLFVAIPAFLEIEFALDLWLGIGAYPEITPTFLRIILIQSAFQVVNRPMVTAVHASGRLKWPNLTAGISLMMMLPVSYLILKLGGSATMVFIVCAFMWTFDNIWDIYWPHKYTGIPVKMILGKIYLNIFIGIIPMFLIPFAVSRIVTFSNQIVEFFVVCGVSVIVSSVVIYFWGLTPGMRTLVNSKLHLNKSSSNEA